MIIFPVLSYWVCSVILGRLGHNSYGYKSWGFPGAQQQRFHLPVQETQETEVLSLGQEDPVEKEMATNTSIFAWRIPMDRGAHGVTESQTRLND